MRTCLLSQRRTRVGLSKSDRLVRTGESADMRLRLSASGRPLRLWSAYARVAGPVGVALVGIAILRIALMASTAAPVPQALGIDWHCNANAARSWLEGNGYFLARQLHGPYLAQTATSQDLGEVLYPPIALLLFVPFVFLPDVAWWLVPTLLTAAAIQRMRPASWSWPILAILLAMSGGPIVAGNPGMWLIPAVLWGLIAGWPGVLVLLKPSVFPLALVGITRRSWWIGLGLLMLVSVPFGSLWVQWVQVIVDQRGSNVFYSLGQWPIFLIPLVAWAARGANRAQYRPRAVGSMGWT
jgi:hypothetical protein